MFGSRNSLPLYYSLHTVIIWSNGDHLVILTLQNRMGLMLESHTLHL